MGYRRDDGLIRGKKGGISSHNTREDWANYYRKMEQKSKQEMEERIKRQLITKRIEPKKFPSYLIDSIPLDKGCYKTSLFYDKRKRLLYFYRGNYKHFYPKIGCPIILTLEDGLEYCCEIINCNDNELEVLICVNNEKKIFPIEYESFFGIWKSSLACITSCSIPFHLFDENIK